MWSRFRPLRTELWDGPFTPANKRRSRHVFSASYSDTINLLDREIGMLGASEFVIEADFAERDIKRDGMPKANARQPDFPGIRIFFEDRDGEELAFQTDVCVFWQHNMRSIALGLGALRAVQRHGISAKNEQYTGFKALPPARPMGAAPAPFANSIEALNWLYDERQTGIRGAEGASLKSVMRMVARRTHPDYGGSTEDWEKFQAAEAILKKTGEL